MMPDVLGARVMRFIGLIAATLCLAVLSPAAHAVSDAEWEDCRQQKDHDLAIRACTKILSESGTSASDRSDALVNRGNAYDDNGDPDRALADYNLAISLNPRNNDAFYNRGITYRRKKEHTRAIADFTEAIRQNPKDAQAYLFRGRSKVDSGDKTGGEADIARARQIDPNVDR
jgi:tetratricopeptide (TPR) repeat protein